MGGLAPSLVMEKGKFQAWRNNFFVRNHNAQWQTEALRDWEQTSHTGYKAQSKLDVVPLQHNHTVD